MAIVSSVPPTTDDEAALAFLDALYAGVEDGYLSLFSIDHATGERFVDWAAVDDVDELAATVVDRAERGDVWFGVATRHAATPGRRGGVEECALLPALWLDIDVIGPTHKVSEGLPATTAAALELLADFPLPPTAVLATGGGLHAWWFLAEPLPVDKAAIELLTAFGTTWTQLAARRELRIDNVFNVDRVMRLPGTLNRKVAGAALPVEVLSADYTRRYGVDDIEAHLLEVPPAPAARPRAAVPYIGPERPGDAYNARHTGGEILAALGFTAARRDRNDDEHWTGPWKETRDGTSATVYGDDGHSTVWSDSALQQWPHLDLRRPYDPFGLLVATRYQGDFAVATAELRRQGYGRDTPLEAMVAPGGDGAGGGGHPLVVVNGRRLRDVTHELLDVLMAANDPPELYVRRGALTRVRTDEDGRPTVEAVKVSELRHRVTRVAHTKRANKPNKDGTTTLSHCPCPLDVANDILVHPALPFPPLEAVVETPTLRPDGSIHHEAGYDPATRLLHIPARGLVVPPVPATPDAAQLAAAVALLREELIVDFPFDTTADEANALGLLLTPFVRPVVKGQVPLALLDAPEPGTGKGLLANVVAIVSTGRQAAARPLSSTDEEVRKMLTSVLREGPAVIVLDNVEDAIAAPSLAAVLTTDEWTDRLLGASETVSVPNRATWIATGNNLRVAGDIARRCYRVRLDAHQAKPYTRSGFRHDDLTGWTQDHRGEIVAAALTLARAWWAAGRPAATIPTLGGFTPWARIVGGILEHAGVTGFLANLSSFQEEADVQAGAWETFLGALRDEFGDRRFVVADVVAAAQREYGNLAGLLPAELVDHLNRPSLSRRIGDAFRKHEGRRYGSEELAVLKLGVTRNKVAEWGVTSMAALTLFGGSGDPAEAEAAARGHAGSEPDADYEPRGHAGSEPDVTSEQPRGHRGVAPGLSLLATVDPASDPAVETPAQSEEKDERGVTRGLSTPTRTHASARDIKTSPGETDPARPRDPARDEEGNF